MKRAVCAIGVAWTAFAFRFSTPYFHNDHFEHLSMARQMLFGELPGRDFIDPGRPLTVALSALCQWLSPTLLSEAVLTMGALAIGAAITFWLASRASRSLLLGIAGAVMVIAFTPRLYSYPKILVFAVALLALWRYIDQPTLRRLLPVALAEVFAFLMRSDFAVYFGVVAGLTVLVTPRPVNWRAAAMLLGAGAVVVAPYAAWLAATGQLAAVGSGGALKVREMVLGGDFPRPAAHFDLSRGIVHVDPVVAHVTVRWTAATRDAERSGLERRYGLVDAVANGPRTFSYGLTDDTHDNLKALLADPHVDDTGGFNRAAAAVDRTWPERLARRLPFDRVVWGPYFSLDEAGVWLYYFLWGIPIVALLVVIAKHGRAESCPHEWSKIGSAALLGVMLNLYLIRGDFDSRLADVILPAGVVAPWLLRQAGDLIAHITSLPWRRVALLIPAAVVLLFWVSLTTYDPSLSVGRLVSAPVRLSPLRKASAELGQRPLDFYAPPGDNGVKRLTRYVHDCLPPEDRLLLVAYEPQVFYYSERLFAGGMEYFHQARFNSDAEQALTVRRLAAQRAPLVLIDTSRRNSFEEDYPQVAAYVRSRYEHAADATFTDNRTWELLAARSLPPVSTHEGLPCWEVTIPRTSP